MPKLNQNYDKLQANYLFAEIARRVQEHVRTLPDATRLVRLGIGDVTEPLPQACLKAFHEGVDELARAQTFRGYGPSEGYAFLREAIRTHDFAAFGAEVDADEIFVSDGAKCDTANFQELFAKDNRIAVPDPVYPVYVDSNVMAGRTGSNRDGRYEGLVYLEGRPDNDYLPALPEEPVDLVYLCFPNNPTGRHIDRAGLQAWVDWALETGALILYDAAYEAFIRDDGMPHSIFELPGARECAVEFRSFSKNAGFTGVRCAYTVVPKSVQISGTFLHALWNRRHNTKFNGVSYPVQKAAAAVFSDEGRAEVRALTDFYMENARILRETLLALNLPVVGGRNAPYLWVNSGGDSWAFFDRLLKEADLVCTPGAGFGRCGEGHIRFSAFNSRANILEACERLRTIWR